MVSLVRKDEVTQELLEFNKTQEGPVNLDLKDRLSVLMNSDELLYDSVRELIGEENMDSNMRKVLKDINKPLTLLKRVYKHILESY